MASRQDERTGWTISTSLFLRALAAIYFIAFVSLWTQLAGLIGQQGILPAHGWLDSLAAEFDRQGIGLDRFRIVPTLCWLSATDGFLVAQCAAGAVLSLALFVGLAPAPCLLLLWLLYLSLATVGGVFLAFQWDNLLLETGFLAVFLAPWSARPRRVLIPRSFLAVLLLRLLLFKLMLSSGCVKLSSGDPSWRDLSALSFHYQTQPLPTWLAWYANRLPLWLHKACCAAMFTIELVVPFLMFLARPLRLLSCGLLAFLQLLIALTGNYTFFNWLTLALCLLLVDDRTWARWTKRPGGAAEATQTTARRRALPVAIVAAMYVPLAVMQTAQSAGLRPSLGPLSALDAYLAPLRTISGYGLFAVMTTERREIVVEGSDDGQRWTAYELPYKPGDPLRRPTFVAPHQPRLDWQMWFAALGSYRDNRWFVSMCMRLLQGSTDVLALFAGNPFPHGPPKQIRASLYRYDFSEQGERRATGAWWTREHLGQYLPPVSLSPASSTP